MSFHVYTHLRADHLTERLEKLRKEYGERLKIHGFDKNENSVCSVLIEIEDK